ncbi:MAG: two-component system response regulator [Acidobacteriota bacterium]
MAGHGRECEPAGCAIPVLIVSPYEEDHTALARALTASEFQLRSAHSFREAEPLVGEIPVIIAECNLDGCCWKDLWQAVQNSPKRPWPRLIVAAEADNERLWSEVISLGAQDVLAKPFDYADVRWVVKDAWASWNRERGVRSANRAARMAHAG